MLNVFTNVSAYLHLSFKLQSHSIVTDLYVKL